ncbi:hypothetical protein [Phenylobacterium sp.]|uniref:hypothetical protein n=1 Tax=Phenylobacterium sp. TaxID=1871053 RepID=UPI002D0B2EE8|nr:hypothetical protein [Phenylobacterium sp.]HLZ77160.1 hypothetical protein [Phenylobacterium sp.]
MAEERKTQRFALRRDRTDWTVYEVWTGEPAVIAMVPQTGLSEEDAQHTADLLNRRARNGDRSMRQ